MRKAMQLFSFLAIIAFVGSYGSAMAQTAAATAAPTPVVTTHGLVDTYYTYDLANSDYHENGRGTGDSYDQYDNSVVLGLAELNVGASMGEGSAYLSLGYGNTIDENTYIDSDTGNHSAADFDVLQAYVQWNPGSWTFKAGRFYTWIGQEVVESNSNWNYSRSFSFQYLDPVFHTGASVNYAFSSQYNATLYMVDGNNSGLDVYGTRTQKSWGIQFQGMPTSSLTFNINGEYWYPEESWTHYKFGEGIIEPNVTWNVTSDLSVAADYTFTYLDNGDGYDTASGLALYGKYALSGDTNVAVRGENVVFHGWYSYEDGVENDGAEFGPYVAEDSTGDEAVDLSEVTLTLSHTISSNLLTRAEVRYDWATDDLTGKPAAYEYVGDNAPVGAFTGTLSAVYSF